MTIDLHRAAARLAADQGPAPETARRSSTRPFNRGVTQGETMWCVDELDTPQAAVLVPADAVLPGCRPRG